MRFMRIWVAHLAALAICAGCGPQGPTPAVEKTPAGTESTTREEPGGVKVPDGATSEPAGSASKETAAEPADGTAPKAKLAEPIILEAENLTLKNAKIQDLKGASNGKAVLLDQPESQITGKIMLKKGEYEVTVYVFAPDGKHDALYLTLANVEERLFPEEWAALVATQTITVQIIKDKECDLEIVPAETGVSIDRIVIKQVK